MSKFKSSAAEKAGYAKYPCGKQPPGRLLWDNSSHYGTWGQGRNKMKVELRELKRAHKAAIRAFKRAQRAFRAATA